MEKDIKNQTQFIACPSCRTGNEIGCNACGGFSFGSFLNGHFLYWGKNLNPISIKAERLKKILEIFINFLFYAVGILGLVAFGWWMWLESLTSDPHFLFWRVKNSLILAFWAGLLAFMFIVYRSSRQAGKKINREKFKETRLSINNWGDIKNTRTKADVSIFFNQAAIRTVEEGFLMAKKMGQAFSPAHLLLSSMQDEKVATLFFRLNANYPQLRDKIKNLLTRIEAGEGIKDETKEILIEAFVRAYENSAEKVESIFFLAPLFLKDENLREILYDAGIDDDKILNSLEWIKINNKLVERYRLYKKMARFKPSSNMDRAYTAVATPVLDHFGSDMTLAAKWGRLELCIAREKEIENIFNHLESGHSGVILVGNPGVGKNAVIAGLAELMVEENVPENLKDKRLVELDVARLVSGAAPEQAQERLLTVIDEVAVAGNIILYISNIERIFGIQAGEEESLDLSEVLASALENKRLYCFASATDQNYRKYIESQPLGNVLAKVEIKEPVGNQAIQIIEGKIGRIENKYNVYFSYDAISEAVKLSSRYMHDKYLPEKAVNILEETAVRASKAKKELVTEEDIAQSISEITNIPVTKITQKESEALLNLEAKIHERMIGQEEAVDIIAASLRRARVELREGKRPIASFLFLGPTGVGKTELAKTIAEVYFGDEATMIRLDMSEYQHPDSVQKMIGNNEQLGYLTEAVRQKPFSLILLDEFEKAHADILNLFLQVMDDGRLTDGQGRTIDFTNSIIIATSNAGALFIEEEIIKGTSIEAIKQSLVNEQLNKIMRPELINRFDGIIVFKPLSLENVISIARLMLKKVEKKLEEKGIGLKVDEQGIRNLAEAGFDPKFGARPLRRVLQDNIENTIANKILAGELERRDAVVIGRNAEITIEKGKEL